MKQSNSQIRDDATNLKEAIEYYDGRSAFTQKAEKKRKKLRALLSGMSTEERSDTFSDAERIELRVTADWRTEEHDGKVTFTDGGGEVAELEERAEYLEQNGLSYAASDVRKQIAELEGGQ